MIKRLFKKYDIELSEKEIKKFEKFLEIFKEKNSQINLSAIREDEAIIEKHFIDSIMLNIFLEFTILLTSTIVKKINNIKVADL
jgi:16S rRNA (guanine527-N7)-methyltransferase